MLRMDKSTETKLHGSKKVHHCKIWKVIEIIKVYKDSSVVKSEELNNQFINLTPLEYYVDAMKVKVSIS